MTIFYVYMHSVVEGVSDKMLKFKAEFADEASDAAQAHTDGFEIGAVYTVEMFKRAYPDLFLEMRYLKAENVFAE